MLHAQKFTLQTWKASHVKEHVVNKASNVESPNTRGVHLRRRRQRDRAQRRMETPEETGIRFNGAAFKYFSP